MCIYTVDDVISACNVSSCAEEEPESSAALTPEQREQLRVHKINAKKLHIAGLGSAIISDPYSNVRLAAGLGSDTHKPHYCLQLLLVC